MIALTLVKSRAYGGFRLLGLAALWLLALSWATAAHVQANAATLWQIGRADDSAAEFSAKVVAPGGAIALAVPADWAGCSDWSSFPDGLRGDSRPALEVAYDLPAVPANGVVFSFKLLNAPKSGAQMAVFSNRLMAGLVQLWGTAGSSSPYQWKKTYRLYIPKEMLAAGKNVLRLQTVRPIWSDASADKQIWFQWDWLRLEALAAPAREPIHGNVAYLGTTLRQSSGTFAVNDDTLRLAPDAFSWLGIAYSGNTIRCDFWQDVARQQPRRLEYLQLLRDLNLTAMVDFVSGSHFHNDKTGKMPPRVEQAMEEFFASYGQLFQYYELGNEPCMFGGGLAETLEVGRLVNRLKAPHVKATAVGWAYGGGRGTPINWDADPANRRRVEALCQATNGHSYGYSYADNRGGSFLETLATYGGVEDGWPVECLASETGTNDWHSEENGPRLASSQPHAQAFDRILRAHIAVVDRTMQHAAVFDDFGMFKSLASPVDPAALTVLPGVNGEDPRLKTYRRIALAYATHGAPLTYVWLNPEAVAGKMAYVRCVDTAAIPALPGSGGTSNKILLNFVNFENAPQSFRVRVTLPAKGTYAGERFGAGDSYAAARREIKLEATPTVDVSEDLGPGEAAQYILTPPGAATPYPPMGVHVTPGEGQLDVAWAASSGATSYEIQRAAVASGNGPANVFETIARDVAQPPYIDKGLAGGGGFAYRILATSDAGRSEPSESAASVVGLPLAPTEVAGVPGDRRVALEWKAPPRAKTYLIRRTTGVAGSAPRTFAGIAQTQFEDVDLVNGTSYRYEVFSIGATGLSSDSPAVTQVAPEDPPATPGGLVAVAGEHRVVLNWVAVPGALTYVVERSAEADGPLTTIASDVPTSAYVDSDIANGKTYRYAVAAKKVALASAFSESISAAPAAEALPAPWQQADIGAVGKKGKAAFTPASNVLTVLGAGEDVWKTADGGHLVFQPLDGDGQIIAHVVNSDDTHEWAKVGIMLRQSTDAGAAMALLSYSQSKGCGLTYRAEAAGECKMIGGNGDRWLKLVRKAGEVQGFISPDGVHWRPRGVAHVALGDHPLVGLFVCSHRNDTLNRSMFDSVAVERTIR